ncbi:TrbG/VirB9 family P-type conjugative transfer protein [Sphingomonas sp. R-74633]|uniref:TrbG/VirB9 family P-type conjugative transfer protein n=1 Tax=Sphingomonas sp. R-74633 TaxID=2751188 RepID=UPI0015D17A75|nr:TrbG/VirB9 family P-type conjugative transfer protein [Sphingomonas sp. R-74633]NYT40679.1 TrbG/VirB9 family P-type conjugative transfer protein [Sphingomonas sp. R-74633]
MKHTLALLLALPPGVAAAQVTPQPDAGDAHIQLVDYRPEQVIRVEVAPGYQATIELAADEHIENVALGDSGAWQVSANRRGDRLFIKPTVAGITTNMAVVTDTRLYNFELVPGIGVASAWSVRFRYPGAGAQSPGAAGDKVVGRYKVRGEETLRPSGIHDDGVHTYIEWPEDKALPAIYALNGQGKETLINGMMRDGRMVIDSVQDALIFRIDKQKARAVRVVQQP